ncbi:TBC1 domain family member 20-like isoform X2 [Zophobas morio]|uniref:TBC1 domain family member 20-like isoform X2 n=1 Tax=Zophobas morio TaxID=2755281 RepID=UPI003083EBE6
MTRNRSLKDVGSNYLSEKKDKIIEAIRVGNTNVIRQLATSKFGLMHPKLRAQAWPLLLGLRREELMVNWSYQRRAETRDKQAALDTKRSYINFPPGIFLELREELLVIINETLARNTDLVYYQGFHDFCSVFHRVLGKESAVHCVERLSSSLIRDFFASDLAPVLSLIQLLTPLLRKLDFDLYQHFQKGGHFDFAGTTISWILTWFSHDIQATSRISTLFDLFLAYPHPLVIIYACAAVLIDCRKLILQTPCEYTEIFRIVKACPEKADVEQVVSATLAYLVYYKPTKLLEDAKFNTALCSSVSSYPFTWINDRIFEQNLLAGRKVACYLPKQRSKILLQRLMITAISASTLISSIVALYYLSQGCSVRRSIIQAFLYSF